VGFATTNDKSVADVESSVLEIARDFLLKLGKDDIPRSVVWVLGAYQPDKPALLRKHRLGLREEMQGKLTPEEWRPLLASSILIRSRMGRKSRILDLVIPLLFPPLILVIFLWFLWIPLLPRLPADWFQGSHVGLIEIIPLLLWVGLVFLFFRITGPYRRRLRFRADEIVSREFGMRNELLESLRKIDSMSIVDTGRFSNAARQATIEERIANLQRMSG